MSTAIVQIGLLVSLVIALAMAVLSYKTTRIYNIVLMFLVFCAVIPYAYLAARTLKTQKAWRELALKQEKELEDLDQKIEKVTSGDMNSSSAEPVNRTPDTPPGLEYSGSSIRELEIELRRMAVERGGTWRDLQVANIKAADGSVNLTINSPEPHDMAEKMVVFVFDGQQYLGEFKVTRAGKDKSVGLAPNLNMDASDLRHLADSKGDWTIYQVMPFDDPAALASLTDQERRKLLPKDSVEAMANPARTPRNYEYIFHNNNQLRILTEAEIVAINENIPRVDGSKAKAEEETKYREQEKTDLEYDLKNFRYEAQAIAAYVQQLRAEVVASRAALKALYLATMRAAAEVTELQLRAAERIDAQTDREQAAVTPAQP